MTIVAEVFTHVIGVDTHASKHAYAIVDATNGALIAQREFPTTVPNQLGVDYNARLLESLVKYVAPALGWR